MNLLGILATRSVLSLPRQRLAGQAVKLTASYATTVNQSDVDHLSKYSKVWWDSSGQMRPLHAMNQLRMQLIVDGLANVAVKTEKPFPSLEGLKIMDVGCGGGILSEPLARAGAEVTGLDASEDLIKVARHHAASDPQISSRLNYVQAAVEDFAVENEGAFDAVVASEVLEHVDNVKCFAESCVKVLKPGGSIFVTTINRTFISWLAGVIIAENFLGIVPKGTHDWRKFISPEETQRLLRECGCRTKLIHGMMYNPLTNAWSWSDNTQLSYGLHAVKSKRKS